MGAVITSIKHGHEGQYRWENSPNSAGGVSVCFNVYNNDSSRTIKYVDVEFIPYNAVNDAVTDSISGKQNKKVRITGPIKPKEYKFDNLFKNAWYNPSITSVKVHQITVTYMDGDVETIDGRTTTDLSGVVDDTTGVLAFIFTIVFVIIWVMILRM